MGAKLSRGDQDAGDRSPGTFSRRSVSSRLSRRTTKSTEDGTSTLPFNRGASLSKRFRRSCRNWATKKGLVDKNKVTEAGKEENRPDEKTVETEPEEVTEEDDVTEEPEIDVAVIVAELVVEAHRRKLASRAQSKEAVDNKEVDEKETYVIKVDIENQQTTMTTVTVEDYKKEELLLDSDRCEEETLATLVETEAVIEIQVTSEEDVKEVTTSSFLETETEIVSEDKVTEIPAEDSDHNDDNSHQNGRDESWSQGIKLLSELGNVRAQEESELNNESFGNKDNTTDFDIIQAIEKEDINQLAEEHIIRDDLEETIDNEDDKITEIFVETHSESIIQLPEDENKNESSEERETQSEKISQTIKDGKITESSDKNYIQTEFINHSAEEETIQEEALEKDESCGSLIDDTEKDILECERTEEEASVPEDIDSDTKEAPEEETVIVEHGVEEVECETVIAGNQPHIDQEKTHHSKAFSEGENELEKKDVEKETSTCTELSGKHEAKVEDKNKEVIDKEVVNGTKEIGTLFDSNELGFTDSYQVKLSAEESTEKLISFDNDSLSIQKNDKKETNDQEVKELINDPEKLKLDTSLEDNLELNRSYDTESLNSHENELEVNEEERLVSHKNEEEDNESQTLEINFLTEAQSYTNVEHVRPIEMEIMSLILNQVIESSEVMPEEEGLKGGAEARADSFMCGMSEAQYVEVTPPPSILVPTVTRDQEEDNTTFIGLREEPMEDKEDNSVTRTNTEPHKRIPQSKDQGNPIEGEEEDDQLVEKMIQLGFENIKLVTPLPEQALKHDVMVNAYFSHNDEQDSMLVLDSSSEDEDCSEFFSEEEDEDEMIDERPMLENIEEEDEEASITEAEEDFPGRAAPEMAPNDRERFSGAVVANSESGDDSLDDASDTDGEATIEREGTTCRALEKNVEERMEERLEFSSLESQVTVIDRDEGPAYNAYLAEGNKMSAMEFLMFHEAGEDLEFFPGEEEMRMRDEGMREWEGEMRGREHELKSSEGSRSRPTSDFRSSFESFLSISSDVENDIEEEGEDEVSSDEGIDDNDDKTEKDMTMKKSEILESLLSKSDEESASLAALY